MSSNNRSSSLERSDSIEILLDDDLKSALQYAADLCGLSLDAFILGASTSEAIKIIHSMTRQLRESENIHGHKGG